MDKNQRRRQLVLAAVDDAKANGLTNVNFDTVAQRADVSSHLVRHYFCRIGDMWKEIGLMDERLRDEAEKAGILFDAD